MFTPGWYLCCALAYHLFSIFMVLTPPQPQAHSGRIVLWITTVVSSSQRPWLSQVRGWGMNCPRSFVHCSHVFCARTAPKIFCSISAVGRILFHSRRAAFFPIFLGYSFQNESNWTSPFGGKGVLIIFVSVSVSVCVSFCCKSCSATFALHLSFFFSLHFLPLASRLLSCWCCVIDFHYDTIIHLLF